MEYVLLSLIIFIIGFGFGISFPFIIKKYLDIFKIDENLKKYNELLTKEEKNDENTKTTLTPKIISEWQTGLEEGDEDNE